MSKVRKDTWSESDDTLLAEIVINHIATGSTQIKAFEEVAEQLNRTPQAVGFRWNSRVRKEYEKEIEEAKQSRRKEASETPAVASEKINEPKDYLDLTSLTNEHREVLEPLLTYLIENTNNVDTDKLKEEYNRLKDEYEQLQRKYSRLEEEHHRFLTMVVKAQEQLQNKLA